MKTMKMLHRPHHHLTAAGTIAAILAVVVIWFVWAIDQAYAGETPTRAITAPPEPPHSDLATCRVCWEKDNGEKQSK